MPDVGLRALVVVGRGSVLRRPARRDRVVHLGRRRGRAAAFGDVLGLQRQGGDEVADRVEAVPVGQPPGRQQPADVVLRPLRMIGASAASLAPGGQHLAGAAVQGDQGGQLVEGLPDRADEQEADHAQQRPEAETDHLPGQRAAAGVDQQRVHRGAAFLVVRVAAGERRTPDATVGGLDVEDHRRGHHDRLVAGRRGAPAEVDVVAEHRELVVEATQVLEHRAAHEHAGGVHGEHGAHLVVLALVVLAALQPGLAAPGAGDRHAHLEQAAQRGPLAQLGAEHVGLGVGLGGGQQLGQRVGCRVGVVVQDPDPLERGGSLPGVLQAEAYGGRERRRRRRAHHGSGPERRPEQVSGRVLAAGVHGDDPTRTCALALEAGDHRGQPPGAVMADDEREDALSRGRIHGGSR